MIKKTFSEKKICQNVPLDFKNLDLTTLARNFSYWADIFLLKIRKVKNKLGFSKSFYSSPKRCAGHVGCSFENSAQIILLENRFFLAKISGKTEKTFFPNNCCSSKRSTGDVKCTFDNPAKTFWKKPMFFDENPKFMEKLRFIHWKMFFSRVSFRYVESRFGNRSKKLQLKVKLFSTPCDEMMKQVFFTANLINISPGHSESSFENPAENLLHRVPKWQKTIFQKIYLSSERYSRHSEASFDNRTDTYVSPLDRNVFNKSPKLFSRQSEADKKTMVFSIKAFFPRFSFR